MAKAVAKAKKKLVRKKQIEENFSPKAQKKAERKIGATLMELDERAEARMKWVNSLLEINDDDLLTVIETMVENLHKMQGLPRLVIDGVAVNLKDSEFQMLQKIQERNFRWIAMRCVVACAEWGIRLANFKAPKGACLRCEKKVK